MKYIAVLLIALNCNLVAGARPPQAPLPPQAPPVSLVTARQSAPVVDTASCCKSTTPAVTRKSAPCSDRCTCGCVETGRCDCPTVRAQPAIATAPAYYRQLTVSYTAPTFQPMQPARAFYAQPVSRGVSCGTSG